MLNKNNERELAYLVRVDAITPMNADRLECAHVGGWHCVVGKGEFSVGDPAVYFEIDSQLPNVEPFSSMEFLKSKHFKIKSQKIRGEVSQGLLVPVTSFGWMVNVKLVAEGDYEHYDTSVVDGENVYCFDDESRFLTKRLGVTYADPGDNARKSNGPDKYKRMAQRHPSIFKKPLVRWIMQYKFGRKIMFSLFGKKRDAKGGWVSWITKTDEERVQNMPWLFPGGDEEFIATEKIDGTSFTAAMENNRKKELIVCSRNVVFDRHGKKCFYDTNVYVEAAEKYDMENVLKSLIKFRESCGEKISYAYIQGEIYGEGIQKRVYQKEHKLAIFNIVVGNKESKRRLGTLEMKRLIEHLNKEYGYNLETVPILDEHFKIPATCEELLEIANGCSVIDGCMREGLVIRSKDGERSFKAVSNDFLLKYHST